MSGIDLTLDRGWAATVLVDSCTITKDATGDPTFDEDLGKVVYATDVVCWSGPCSVGNVITDRRIEQGANPQVEGDWLVRVPLNAEGIEPGMVVTVDSVHAGGDPDLVGLRLLVHVVGRRSSAVLRRLQCTLHEQTPP